MLLRFFKPIPTWRRQQSRHAVVYGEPVVKLSQDLGHPTSAWEKVQLVLCTVPSQVALTKQLLEDARVTLARLIHSAYLMLWDAFGRATWSAADSGLSACLQHVASLLSLVF